ncbi:MAG: DUF2194 domain-containing protein [Lachnospiraceae bacterium]|nr:DUF2194 domain-containing protein [Lachnospiraceae bacterium]
MISRRNYLSITIMMGIIFFLFLFSGAAKSALSHYEVNEYAWEDGTPKGWKADAGATTETHGVLLYLGANDSMLKLCQRYCMLRQYTCLDSIEASVGKELQLVVVDGVSMSEETWKQVQAYHEAGIPIVFGSLPSSRRIGRDIELAGMLGITNIQASEVELSGMTLYENFLVGDKVIYQAKTKEEQKQQDLNLSVPWYVLNSGTKVYMDGLLPDTYDELDAAYKPPVVWRYRNDKGCVFAVNSDFFTSDIGLGMLCAMESELSEQFVYPIINAQNLVALNYPTFMEENTDTLRKLYSRDVTAVLRDLVWPGIVAVSEHNHGYPSVCMSPKLDYGVNNWVDGERVAYYLQLLREQHGEAGINLCAWAGATTEEKLAYDKTFFDTYAKEYAFQFAYAKDLTPKEAKESLDTAGFSRVRALLCDYSEDLPLVDVAEGMLLMQVTNEGSSHTYREDLRMRSIQTILGYSVIGQDFSQIVYPWGKSDQWEKVFDRFSSYTNTYWRDYHFYEETTISQAAGRTNRFLQLSYEVTYGDKDITITSDASAEAPVYFVVKSDTAIRDVEGGSFQPMDANRWLITATDATVRIAWDSDADLMFWR